MTIIDIGAGAINRASAQITDAFTYIDLNNPANADGILDVFKVWFNVNATGVKVGTFFGSGSSYTSRGVATLGSVISGSEQIFTGLTIPVVAGDFLGIYWATGDLELDTTGGAGFYFKAGDQFGAGAQTYTLSASAILSLFGSGMDFIPTMIFI